MGPRAPKALGCGINPLEEVDKVPRRVGINPPQRVSMLPPGAQTKPPLLCSRRSCEHCLETFLTANPKLFSRKCNSKKIRATSELYSKYLSPNRNSAAKFGISFQRIFLGSHRADFLTDTLCVAVKSHRERAARLHPEPPVLFPTHGCGPTPCKPWCIFGPSW